MSPTQSTLSDDAPPLRPDEATVVWLSFVAHYDAPLAPPALAIVLERGRTLEIGRGTETRVVSGSGRTLRVEIADPWCSTRHATLRGSRLEDSGSRNGVHVNGVRATAADLTDGDLVELGHALLRFDRVEGPRAAGLLALSLELRDQNAGSLSPAMLAQLERVRRVAPSQLPVLVLGETGSGKEELSRAVHAWSGRPGELVAVNCAAIPTHLAEGELFGYRRGAFTGADRDRVGLVAAADGGTLLLDEVDALPPEVQPKLLRFLQDKRVRRLGETTEREVDVRVIAASNARIAEAVEAGRFRADLYARLRGLVVDIPPLRARKDDLGLLVARLLRRHLPAGAPEPRLTAEAWRVLARRSWPQNVRELERCLEVALLLVPPGQPIDAEQVAAPAHASEPRARGGTEPAAPEPRPAEPVARRPRRDLQEVEVELRRALAEHEGNVAAAARRLGVSRMQVYRWIERFGLDAGSFKQG